MKLTKNVGQTDRYIRMGAGAVLIVVGAVLGGGWLLLALIGLVLVVTGAIGYCGLYQVLGISTAKPQGRTLRDRVRTR